jgi:hypothetical protein
MKLKVIAVALLIGIGMSIGVVHSKRTGPTMFGGDFLEVIEDTIISVVLAANVIWITRGESPDSQSQEAKKRSERKGGVCQLAI